MKKLVTATLIPALAAIAVIGSGFSVFYFGNSEMKATKLDPTVENVVTSGTITTPATLKLHLDQTLDTRKAIAGGTVFTGEAKGIYLTSDTESEKLTIKYARPEGGENTDFVNGVAKVYLHTYVTIPDAYVPYVTVIPGTNTTDFNGDGSLNTGAFDPETNTVDGENCKTLILAWTLSSEQLKAGDIERNLPGYGATDPLFTFAYADTATVGTAYETADRKGVATNEPINSTEYAKMKAAVMDPSAGNIKITTTVTFVAA